MFYVTTTHSFYLIVGHLRLQILNLTLLSLFFIDNIKAIARNISTLKHLKPWQEIGPMVTWWQVTVLFTWSLIDGVISTNYLDSQPLQLRRKHRKHHRSDHEEGSWQTSELLNCWLIVYLFVCVCSHVMEDDYSSQCVPHIQSPKLCFQSRNVNKLCFIWHISRQCYKVLYMKRKARDSRHRTADTY